uniref:Uncharacterized protein n=1 Tax=Rhizophora mucronata TaxID=61149 RepID=A0A2P2LBH5_RHIMU
MKWLNHKKTQWSLGIFSQISQQLHTITNCQQ